MANTNTVEHHYIHINDIRMHYVKAGHGERLIVLLHGFPGFWYSWRHQIPVLSEHFTVVAPDMRGYNDTDKPNWGYEADVLVNDIVSLIRELGYIKAIVVGHDWGGVIAWGLATAYPHRVERLIILNAPHPVIFAEALSGGNRQQMMRSSYIGFFQLPFVPEAMIRANNYAAIEQMLRGEATNKSAFTDEDIRKYKEALAKPGALTAALNYYRAAPHSTRDFFSSTDMRVHAPTLVIWGEQDVALGKELTDGLEQFAPNLQIRYLPSCSHWVQEECPEKVNEYMLEFLADT